MRINVYTEELEMGDSLPAVEIVSADYVSSRTGKPMTNYGLRIFLKSSSVLHYIPGRDDDRSAITFWCGDKRSNIFQFLEMIRHNANEFEMLRWRTKMDTVAAEAEIAETNRVILGAQNSLQDFAPRGQDDPSNEEGA